MKSLILILFLSPTPPRAQLPSHGGLGEEERKSFRFFLSLLFFLALSAFLMFPLIPLPNFSFLYILHLFFVFFPRTFMLTHSTIPLLVSFSLFSHPNLINFLIFHISHFVHPRSSRRHLWNPLHGFCFQCALPIYVS